MAKYTVTHSCGHEQEHILGKFHAEREQKLGWLATQPCKICFRDAEEAKGPHVLLRAYAPSELMRETDSGIEIVVTRCYAYNETLRDRGYRFNHLSYGALGAKRGAPAWMKKFTGKRPDCLTAELDWLEDQGWEMVIESPFNAILSGLFEGRPDLTVAAAAPREPRKKTIMEVVE